MTDAYYVPQNKISAMKQAIIDYGAGEFGMEITFEEQADGSADYTPCWSTTNQCVYTNKATYKEATKDESSNLYVGGHAVTVIGWDDNFSKDKFGGTRGLKPSKDGAWLCQNSWSYNDAGGLEDSSQCFWVSYYDYDVYNLDEIATFYNAVPKSEAYDTTYQYDGGYNADTGFGSAKKKQAIKSANVFKASTTSSLEAVGYYNLSGSMKYSIQIYKNPKKTSDPTSGKAMLSKAQTGSLTFDGYYTIKLNKELSLSKGTKFAVVVTATSKTGYSYVSTDVSASSYPFEYSHTKLKIVSTSSKGQSYYKKSGKSWVDYGKKGHNNVRIKAYVNEAD
jgi:hypothetical protein